MNIVMHLFLFYSEIFICLQILAIYSAENHENVEFIRDKTKKAKGPNT